MGRWWYVSDGGSKGPVSEEELHHLLIGGTLASSTLVWTKDMEEWKPADQIEGLASLVTALPPEVPPSKRLLKSNGILKTPDRKVKSSTKGWAFVVIVALFVLPQILPEGERKTTTPPTAVKVEPKQEVVAPVDMSPAQVEKRKKLLAQAKAAGVLSEIRPPYDLVVDPDLFAALPFKAKEGFAEAARGYMQSARVVFISSTTNKVIGKYTPGPLGLRLGGSWLSDVARGQ